MAAARTASAIVCTLGIGLFASAQTAPPDGDVAQGNGHNSEPAKALNNDTPARVGMMMQQTGGSLLKATLATKSDPGQAKLADISFFAVKEPEPRTLHKHDLVTIVIREESAITSQATKDLKKEQDLTAKLDQFIKIDLKKLAIRGFNPSANPADIDVNGIREFKANGEMDRSDSLTARITAEVLDVKPNGTLVLQARKSIKTDEEEQQFILSGICRAEDVAADNTVLSTQIYDLQLQKNHKGDVRAAVKQGWIPKLLDFVNPF